MCFIKSGGGSVSSSESTTSQAEQQNVVQHEADASVTKNSSQNSTSGYKENLKTSALGLTEEAKTNKKTLLGE